MTQSSPIVFLVDVDNTLLDNDRLLADLRSHIAATLGHDVCERYWAILLALAEELGFRDYLGALQRLRRERPEDLRLFEIAAFLLDYPVAERLYPGALDVLAHLATLGPTVLLSDGDAVFQPRKITRAGLAAAVENRVLIYIHKEHALDDVRRRHPAERYVLIDDKPNILAAVKKSWGERVRTILPLQGHYALDPGAGAFGAPDVTVGAIGKVLELGMAEFEAGSGKPSPRPGEVESAKPTG